MMDGIGLHSSNIRKMLATDWLASRKADSLLQEYLGQPNAGSREKFAAALIWTILIRVSYEGEFLS
jgi:hypothetical protein